MLFGVVYGCCSAQSGSDLPGVETVRFRSYGRNEGMSQPTALAIAQDTTGFLWVGTQDGLNRFDGYGFKVYKHDRSDPWSLADNAVYALAVDRSSVLWVGTQAGGLDRYDPALDRFERHEADPSREDALASNHVTALLVDRGDRLWVAAAGASKLQWLDRPSDRFRDLPLGVRAELADVRALAEQPNGTVLIGTHAGLLLTDHDATTLRELRFDPALSLNVQAIAIAMNGDIWASSADAGLFHFSAAGAPLAHFARNADPAHLLPDNEVRGLQFDATGRLWIATKGSGLLRLEPDGGLSVYRHDPAEPLSISGNRQQTVFVDRDGLIWAGSWNNGISMHDPRTEAFARLKPVASDPRTLPSRSVTSMLSEPDGTVWITTPEGSGLHHFDPKRGVVGRYLHDPAAPGSFPAYLVEDMKRTRNGDLWFATAGGGLSRLAHGAATFEHFRHAAGDAESLASDNLLSMYVDHAGSLWIGTLDAGLDELCVGCTRFRHHQHDAARADSIGDGPVEAMLETPDGEFWVGLRPGGLERFDRTGDRFEHFRARADDAASLCNNTITTLMQDSRGEIWIGTQGGGLCHLVPGSHVAPRFEVFDSKAGLAADAIGSVVEDSLGKLWISTTVGISRFDPTTKHVINYGAREGALAEGYYLNTWTRLADGRIAFGGPTGATLFDPAAVALPSTPRPIITDVLLNNRPTPLRWRDAHSPLQSTPWSSQDEVVFDYLQDYVSFEFSAFGFGDPESVEYSYRLEGHDQDWIDTNAKLRYATYTDLPRGSYTLRIRARRDGDAWNTHEAVLNVRVLPPPWTSPLAFFLYALVLTTFAVMVGYRMRANWRREAETQAAIRASEERLKFALWGSGGELWDVDVRTGAMHRENRLEHLLATQEAEEQTLDKYRPYVHPEDLPEFEHRLAAHYRGENMFLEASYRTQGLDGEWHWLLTRGRVSQRDANGQALRITGTTQDITTLKRAEELLRRLNEELESRVETRTADLRKANEELRHTLEQLTLAQRHLLEAEKMAALGGLVAGVAHEINTPLGITVTAASHLQEETKRIVRLTREQRLTQLELDDFQQVATDSAEIILRNLHRADRLIKSFKLIAVDQTVEERRTVELGAYLNEILTSLGPVLKKTPHKIAIDCAVPVQMHTYPGAIYQIVSNLVMNSLTHAFEANVAGRIDIVVRQMGSVVQIQYRDNGKGMSENVRAQIYEPFFTTRRGQGGSGLGMHVVYNLVTQLLKGNIRVESTPGVGSMFEIFLPLELAPVLATTAE